MDKILGCDFISLYPEAIDHCLLKSSKSTVSLLKCLKPKPKADCREETFSVCNFTNLDDRIRNGCHATAAAARKCFNHKNEKQCGRELDPYMSRLGVYPDISASEPCIHKQEKTCQKHRIKAVKVVRMTMQSVKAIINKIPDIKIIYYVMDPRMLYVSRKGHVVPIGNLCEQMSADHKIYLDLKKQFPNSMHILKYEDLGKNPDNIVESLYEFLGEPLPQNLISSLFQAATMDSETKNKGQDNKMYTSSSIVDNWREQNSEMRSKKVTDACRQSIHNLNYNI